MFLSSRGGAYETRDKEIRDAVAFDDADNPLAGRHHPVHIKARLRTQRRRSHDAAGSANCQRVDGLAQHGGPKETKGSGVFFVTVHAENLRGPSGFLDTRFEPPFATIQNAPISTPQESLTLVVERLD